MVWFLSIPFTPVKLIAYTDFKFGIDVTQFCNAGMSVRFVVLKTTTQKLAKLVKFAVNFQSIFMSSSHWYFSFKVIHYHSDFSNFKGIMWPSPSLSDEHS